MKVVIISDIHGNYAALRTLSETWDELWVLGDLVNYGPEPKEVVAWVRDHAHVVVRGNHDHAIGFSVDPCCSAPYKALAAATGAFTDSVLSLEEKHYLERLPLCVERRLGKYTFYLCHAVPSDPLFSYRREDDSRWIEEVASSMSDVLLAGHTHIPFIRQIAGRSVMNPGSLGQPKTGSPEACYGIWQDGRLELKRYVYPIEETIEKIQALPVLPEIKEKLSSILRSGGQWRSGE